MRKLRYFVDDSKKSISQCFMAALVRNWSRSRVCYVSSSAIQLLEVLTIKKMLSVFITIGIG